MTIMLMSILSSVMFLITNNTFVIGRVRCEDTINSEKMSALIKESNSLFRKFQVCFLEKVLENIKENNENFFAKKKGLKNCLAKLNKFKFDDKSYKENIIDFLNYLFGVVNNNNKFNCSVLLNTDEIDFLESVDFFSFEIAKKMFSEYKYGTFQTLSDDKERERFIKINQKILKLYADVARQLNFLELGTKYEKYNKFKEIIKCFSDSTSRCDMCSLNHSLNLSETESIKLKKLIDMIIYYDKIVYKIYEKLDEANKEEPTVCNNDLEVIKSKFDIDLKKYVETGENLNVLLYEISKVLNLLKVYLFALNQKKSDFMFAKVSTQITILKIESEISFYNEHNKSNENDEVLKMLDEVKVKLEEFNNNLDSNDSMKN
ncbi:hypothetical protein A0H76_687 [Hepatospora eriocheir]|uniref:Uncharacterized protein n=1 Tax=Hepatospora eriocheir TaxID=1081669 RepID=A0A1X0QIC5_9MICR|nr:hypothetical protein A0H76_687 [Hepatospora eriocheir]